MTPQPPLDRTANRMRSPHARRPIPIAVESATAAADDADGASAPFAGSDATTPADDLVITAVGAPIKARKGQALADAIDPMTVPAAPALVSRAGDKLVCVACGHRCKIGEGKRGICQVRYVKDGILRAPANYVAALQCDPIEKKPFFHVHPGHDALTFGMLGCDFHCSYCQNWLTSQALRDENSIVPPHSTTPDELVSIAKSRGARMVVSSYNEPLITADWAMQVFKLAKQEGFLTGFVSNGNATAEVLDFIRPTTDCYKIDLKSFDDKNYRSLGGVLQHVTDAVRMVHERGFWLEIVTLIVPGFNDSEAELRNMADFIASVSPDIPWHVTAFHQDYRMRDPQNTTVTHLLRAVEIGRQSGLRYVYAGNMPGRVGPAEHTTCPHCATSLIERYGYLIRADHLSGHGTCPTCATAIPGIWR